MSPGAEGSPGGAAPARVTAVEWLRTVHDLDFGSEGIPMVLALMPVTDRVPQAASAAVRADGTYIAALLTEVRAELFPGQRDDDMGCLVSTVQAASAALAGEVRLEVTP